MSPPDAAGVAGKPGDFAATASPFAKGETVMTVAPTPDRGRSVTAIAATVFGGIALLLAVATTVQSASNHAIEADVERGQAQLAKVQALTNVDNSLVQLLAKAAVDDHDDNIRALLARNGVTFRAKPVTAAPPAATTGG